MAYKTIFNEVIFIEGHEPFEKHLGTVTYKKEGLYNNQLKNLDNVKAQLAEKAKKLGANAIINFKYGQKNTSWFRSLLLSLDDNVNWYGDGEAVKISNESYENIVNMINERN